MADRRVLRGTIHDFNYEGALHLIVDDGNYNHAWRVTRFHIAPVDVTSSSAVNRDCCGVLATHAEAITGFVPTVLNWTWADKRQFAWTASTWDDDTTIGYQFNLIDPQHIIVRDMYVGLSSKVATGTTQFNYFIEIERVVLSDDQAIMAIIQEEGQGNAN